jgi:hypothetical protein
MTCEQAGRDLAVQVKRRLKARERGATAAPASIAASGSQLAMGRVVGSLCVVTARDEDATNAMLVGAPTAAPRRHSARLFAPVPQNTYRCAPRRAPRVPLPLALPDGPPGQARRAPGSNAAPPPLGTRPRRPPGCPRPPSTPPA